MLDISSNHKMKQGVFDDIKIHKSDKIVVYSNHSFAILVVSILISVVKLRKY